MIVLKGTHPIEGELCNEFTMNEKDTAIAVGRIWEARGWNPRLLVKSWNSRFTWLTSYLSQRKAA